MNTQVKKDLARFYEQVGTRYPEEDEVYGTLRGMLRKRFVSAFLGERRGALLDIGCNRGLYLAVYRGGPRFGVDLSANVLRQARSRLDAHLAAADAEYLGCFRPGSFDSILCSEVIEHCLDPAAVLRGIHRLLKSGGRALVTTPNYRGARPRWIGLGVLERYGICSDCARGYYHTAYHPGELAAMARSAGLAVIESGTLEREVKYAAKIPALLLHVGRGLNRVLRSPRLARANERLFHGLTRLIYHFAHWTGLEKLLLPLCRHGVRSYIIVSKEDA